MHIGSGIRKRMQDQWLLLKSSHLSFLFERRLKQTALSIYFCGILKQNLVNERPPENGEKSDIRLSLNV